MKSALSALVPALLLLTAVPVLAAGSDRPIAQAQSTAGAASNSNSTTNTATGEVSATNPQSVIDALQAEGYAGKLDKMDSGRTSIAVKISGLNTFIDFYDCADDLTDCYTLLFNVSLDLPDGTTLEEANKWNSEQISGRVWLSKDNDPTLDITVSTFKGMSADSFQQTLRMWDSQIGEFKDFFHF